MTEKLRSGYGYIRVSTHDQEELSPDSQERLLRDYARANGIVLEYIYSDAGISGRKADKRPAFQEMIANAKSKEHPVDVLLVWKFSRFARNQEESIVYKSLLKKAGVEVISVSEPLADGPFGSLIERIIEWMDEYYSIRLSGEVKRGMLENATRGKHQTIAPFGYRMKDGELYVQPDEAEYVRLLFHKYYYDHIGFLPLARWLNSLGIKTIRGNIWENRTVKYILQNPVYKGYTRWNVGKQNMRKGPAITSPDMICVKGSHEPIIDEELFDKVQERLASQYIMPKAKTAAYKHWLGNLVKCSSCGASLSFAPAAKGFQCAKYTRGQCKVSHYVAAYLLEQALFDALDGFISSGSIEYTVEEVAPAQHSDELAILKDSLEKMESREKRIKVAYQNGIDTLEEYKENKALLQKEKDRLQARIDELETRPTEAPSDHHHEMLSRIKNVVDILKSEAPYELKFDAIRSICDKIVYNKNAKNIDIYCVFRQL